MKPKKQDQQPTLASKASLLQESGDVEGVARGGYPAFEAAAVGAVDGAEVK